MAYIRRTTRKRTVAGMAARYRMAAPVRSRAGSSPSVTSKYRPHPPSSKRIRIEESPRFTMREGEKIADYVHVVKEYYRQRLGRHVHPAILFHAVLREIPRREEWNSVLHHFSDVLDEHGNPNYCRHARNNVWVLSLDILVNYLEDARDQYRCWKEKKEREQQSRIPPIENAAEDDPEEDPEEDPNGSDDEGSHT